MDFDSAISNSLSTATRRISCTKAFSPVIARFRWKRQSHPHKRNYQMRIGGSSCISPTRMRRRHSRNIPTNLSTNGQVYWSDTHQLSIYPDNYHREIDQKVHAPYPGSEIITELNVPRAMLKEFFDKVREDFRKNRVDLIYGTVRIIERDDEYFLPWAKQRYACIVSNLHTVHSPEGIERSAEAFRRLIDMAARRGGTYYLTYHRYADRKQIESCYPQFAEFLRLKKKYDPEERFQSDWYRHHRTMFAGSL